MTRVDEFNSFYSSTFADAVQVTYAVCGDRQVAFEATVDAYRRAWRDWTKIRNHHPLGWVRNEAWKLTALSRSTHPLRRKHEEDSDTQLLEALAELSVDDRRLIVLMTLGNTDLEEASREVGVPAEEGIENVTTALASLEGGLRQSIDTIERRMHGLAAATDSLAVPPAATVRTAAKRGRQRNTVLLVAAAVVVILGGGFVATEGDALATSSALPQRQKIGAERPDVLLDAEKIDTGNLLSSAQVSELDPESTWKIDGTDENVDNTTPYATCPTKRYADKDPLKVFVRTFNATGVTDERVAQAIEVSRSEDTASKTYERLVQWYSDCEHPRVQLVAAYTVQRPFGDFQILRLRSHRSPERTFTVGFSHSGTVTSTLVHEADGASGPSIQAFARTLNDSVAKVCKDSGGECTDAITVRRTDPPPTSDAPSFLGIVDLPPIRNVDKVWAGASVSGQDQPRCDAVRQRDLHGQERDPRRGPHLRALPGDDAAQAVRRRRDGRPVLLTRQGQGVRRERHQAPRRVQRPQSLGQDRPARGVQGRRLLRRRVAGRRRGHQGQPGLLPHVADPPRRRRGAGDLHPGRHVRHHPEGLQSHGVHAPATRLKYRRSDAARYSRATCEASLR